MTRDDDRPVGGVVPAPTRDDRLPAPDGLVRVDGRVLRMLGYVDDGLAEPGSGRRRMLLLPPAADLAPLLLGDGGIGLPTVEAWLRLVEAHRAELLGPGTGDVGDRPGDEAAKINFQCDLLDAHCVKNGFKSVSIWLHRNWSADLVARWGEHSNPHTLRRWRARRNSARSARRGGGDRPAPSR